MKTTTMAALAMALVGCGDSDKAGDTAVDVDAAVEVEQPEIDVGADAVEEVHEVDASQETLADGGDVGDVGDGSNVSEVDVYVPPIEGPCDPIDPSHCMFPFPSNLYLVPDATRVTGFTLDLGDALPRNTTGKPIESAPYRRLDGYGVGTPVFVSFPDADLSELASEHDTAPSLAVDAAILWFEVGAEGALTRMPYFVDDDVPETDPVNKVLIVRGGAIMKEATRYVVAFRGLKDKAGRVFTPSPAFAALKAGTTAGDSALAPRQAGFDKVFGELTAVGVDKASLQLAWDFTTASCEALHGPVQHMIADAFTKTGEDGPALVDIVVEELQEDNWALEIRGNIEVPHYLKTVPMYRSEATVWNFNYGPDGLPAQNGTAKAPFWIRVPKSAIPAAGEAATPHAIVMYGHGQNGSGTQVRSGFLGQVAQDYHYVFFATDMWGMAEDDVGGIVDMLFDLSGFPRLADRLQQGLLNHVLLARSMRERLPTLPEISARGIVLDPTRLYYTGISQGGIFGASVVALSPDIQRGHLGVPGNNYSFMLTRSRNFAPFFYGVALAYPERWKQLALVATIDLIWEGADSVSYMRHLHDSPFPGQGPNSVLLAPAKGDVQVAVASNEWVARSGIGIPVMLPYDTERASPSGTETATYPRTGSGIVLYDFGNPWPAPSQNAPPTSEAEDPHESPRRAANHNRQLAHFLETGEIIDVCSDDGVPGCTPE